jgi:hypothetical protein
MANIDPEQSADKLIHLPAEVANGWRERTVRLRNGKASYALATSTYNYSQDEDTKHEIARRVAALWNLAQGIPTAELETLVEAGVKLRKQK